MNDEVLTDRSVNANQRKEARRIDLIRAAFSLFVEKGFAVTRLEDVAVKAGVAKGTVVLYFPSKEALFTAVVEHYVEPTIRQAEVILDEEGTPKERLIRLIRYYDQAINDPFRGALPKLIVAEVGNFPDLAQSFYTKICERSQKVQVELIRQGIAAGEFRAVDPEIYARLLTDPLMMRAIWRHSLGRYEPRPVDPRDYFENHLEMFLKSIVAHEP